MAVLRIFVDVSVCPRCLIASRWKLCSEGEISFLFSENVSLISLWSSPLFCEKSFISYEFLCNALCALCGSIAFECCFSFWNTFCLVGLDCAGGSFANLAVFPQIWASFFVGLRFFLKTCRLLVFGLVLIEHCLFLGLFFADFCFADCFFQILWHFCCLNLLLKPYWACFCEDLLILGLFFRICHPDSVFDFLANFSFCWIFLPTHFGLVFR